ncbi:MULTISPECIES: hypothetical protein [unclassified Sphingobacterium]|uniref:hypothetical protein n=1 Tax=unclassified Sphingobacterium TaxID=2609468 RepID=UPI0025E16A4F|nr:MULTISPECIES: hypothetical protein [unclassified Sphingobacterium]
MKRYLVFVALLGLGLGACKKEESTKPKDDIILIDGEEFEKEFVYRATSKILNVPKDSIYYSAATFTLNIDYLELKIDLKVFAQDLRTARAEKL